MNATEQDAKRVWKLSPAEQAFADVWANKIALKLVRGNRSAAHDLVDTAMAELQQYSKSPFFGTSLCEMGVDTLTANLLEDQWNAGTLEDVLQLKVEQLLQTANMGAARVIGMFQKLLAFSINRVVQLERKQ